MTWDPRWFSSTDETVRIQGSYSNSYEFDSASEGESKSGLLPSTIRGTTAFVSGDIAAKQGFYAWKVDEEQISVNSTITLLLGYVVAAVVVDDDASSSSSAPLPSSSLALLPAVNDAIKGPTVRVVAKSRAVATAADSISSEGGGGGGGGESNRTLAIALPIALVGLAAIVTALWLYLRRGSSHTVTSIRRYDLWPGRHQGYGIRQSRAQRIGPSNTDPATGG